MDLRLVIAVVTASIVLGILAVLSLRVRREPNDAALNITCVLLGVAAGWTAGIFMTPYGEAQASQWRQYAESVSVFVSGYLLAKVDPLITRVLSADTALAVVPGFRLAAFVIAAIVTMILTFAVRAYAFGQVCGGAGGACA